MMTLRFKNLLVFFFTIFFSVCAFSQQSNRENCNLRVQNLRCEQLSKPLGVNCLHPRFSWILKGNKRCNNQSQHAYRILVSSDKKLLDKHKGDIWDSQKVESSRSQQIYFQGDTLRGFNTYYWKVMVWDENGDTSTWSEISEWTMGKLSKKLKGSWINTGKTLEEATEEEKGKAYYFFKNIELKKQNQIKSAKVLITGLGLFELYINQQKVGDHVLDPSDTDYRKNATYVLFDALPYLKKEENSFGVLLGNGKHLLNSRYRNYDLPKLYFELHVTYLDGQKSTFYSDKSWQWTDQTPILYNNEFNGETYDANIRMPFSLTKKELNSIAKPVFLLPEYRPQLRPQLQEPQRVIEERSAIEISEPEPNVYVLDFGQNLTGWCKLQIQGKKHDTISMRSAELLLENGKIDTSSIRGALSIDRYITASDSMETYQPRFTYHGFRYVQVRGLKKQPDSNTIKVCVVHSDLQSTGSFHTKNNTLNAIYKACEWTLKSNYQNLPLDCPQRDERFGWLGDRAATVNGESYMYDVRAIYRKWLLDIKDSQSPEGNIMNVVPEHWSMRRHNMTWPVAYPYIADQLYRQYGDAEIITTHYEPIKNWLTFIEKLYSDNGIIFCDQYGDWSIPPSKVTEIRNTDPRLKSSADILATTAYLHTLAIMKNWATYLDKKDDKLTFEAKYSHSSKQLLDNFMDHSMENYGNNSPTELILLLTLNDLDFSQKDSLIHNLEGKLKGQYNERLVFGLIGMRFLLRSLTENGKLDLAYNLAKQTGYPSLGYMVNNGATTLWELWNGDHRGSQNHIMLSGDLLVWYYSNLGGIRPSDQDLYKKDYQAYQKFILHPYIPKALKSVEVKYNSSQGQIVSNWCQQNESEGYSALDWSIEIPVGATAQIHIPCSKDKVDKIQLNGRYFSEIQIDGFKKGDYIDGQYGGQQVIYLGSGSYQIRSFLEKDEKKIFTDAPIINPSDSLSIKGTEVLIEIKPSNGRKNTVIYYTLDGTDPNYRSKRYHKPFKVSEYTVIKAIAKEEEKEASFIKNAIIDFYDPEENGWKYDYYEESFRRIPNFDTLEACDNGYVSRIDLYKIRKRKHGWATRFFSNLRIPKCGFYTFYLACDDGAALYIDNKLILKNDGVHYKTQRTQKVYLEEGNHKIRLEHFNYYSVTGLELGISGPNLPKQKIPISFLQYEE